MKQNTQSVLLASGGLDSTTLAYWLYEKEIPFLPIFIDYGQHCAEKEYDTLKNVIPVGSEEDIIRINISDIYKGTASRLVNEPNLWEEKVKSEDFYLPYRNLLLLTVGAAFAQARGYSDLYAAFINSNHAKEIDCSAMFFKRLEELLDDYGTIRIEMPFRELSKLDVAKIGLSLNVPIAKTFSCQTASQVPCGACPNCVDRLNAFKSLT